MQSDPLDVAIVGIGCRFPGGVVDVDTFWDFLRSGRNGVGDIPSDRMDVAAFFDTAGPAGKMSVKRGGYLERIDEFDAAFFGISPREAALLDPQQRLLLETAWEALEDAGQDVSKLSAGASSVFIGQWTSDFEARVFAHPEAMDFFAVQGSGRYSASGRISYALGLTGPSLTLDTACSSSLVAVHLAARSVQSGESEMALAGGVNVILQPHVSIAYSQARMLSSDGQCKFGDASGDGYVRSEGAAIVVLKPLARARLDGDRIYAVIRGGAVRNDGNSSGSMGTPSQKGQEALLRAAYENAGVDPFRVGYVEAHGTGTRVGDPVELKAIAATIGRGRAGEGSIYVGSAKTNWGHTEAAAGVAGLIKAALILYNGRIPPSLHRTVPNPLLTAAELALVIPAENTPFPSSDAPGIAGVTALGISGTNAHIVLEAPPPAAPESPVRQPFAPAALLPLSARSPQALRRLAQLTADRLEASGEAWRDICWSATRRRAALSHRAAFAAESLDALGEQLREFAHTDEDVAAVFDDARPRVCFVCPGQGAQWTGMARRLLAEQPTFQAALEACDRAARPYVDYSLVSQLQFDPGQAGYRLDEIGVIQPVLVALAIAYARLLGEFGVTPDAVVGHSMGEVAAAAIAGVIDLDRAMQIICRRSALMQRASGRGAMALVELPMSEAAKRLAHRKDQVSVAVRNSPRSCVISGDADAVREAMAEFQAEGVFCRPVKVDVASHSPQMDEPAALLVAELEGLPTLQERVSIWSTALGRRAEGGDFQAAYWGRNLRQPVLFADAVESLLDAGHSVFVELGPHPVLLHAVEETAGVKGVTVTTLVCGRREEDERVGFLSALGRLWAAGCPPTPDRLAPGRSKLAALPLYPWQRQRYWADIAQRGAGGSRSKRPAALDEEALSWFYTLIWRPKELPETRPARQVDRFLIAGPGDEPPTEWEDGFAAMGMDAVAAPWREFESAFADMANRGAGALGVVLLAPDDADAVYRPISALQTLLKFKGARQVRLWIATRGAQSVGESGEPPVSIDQAAAWGACRAIAEEHPDLWGGLIDLDSDASSVEDVAHAVQHILTADGEDQVAIRSGRRLVLRLAPKVYDAPLESVEVRSDGAYLITGGLGEIGLHVARALAACGATRLILMGRSHTPERKAWSAIDPDSGVGARIAAVRALEGQGVAVHLAAVDSGDAAALQEFLDNYRAEAWPAIRGVVHAAGTADETLSHVLDRRRLDGMLGPKLRGAQTLDRLLPKLDFFVLMSSIASFLPHSGQASYAAANAGLDALAHDRRSRGAPAVSVAWGVWSDTGMMKGGEAALKFEELKRQGISAIAPTQGSALIPYLMRSPTPALAILPVDWAAFGAARAARMSRIFEDVVAAAGPRRVQEQNSAATSIRSRADLEQTVRKALATVLRTPSSKLDPRKPLGAMGLTSLMAIELRNFLEAALNRPLSATLAWNHPTIEALVDFLDDRPSKGTALTMSQNDPSSRVEVAIDMGALEQLSDEEAIAALRNVGSM